MIENDSPSLFLFPSSFLLICENRLRSDWYAPETDCCLPRHGDSFVCEEIPAKQCSDSRGHSFSATDLMRSPAQVSKRLSDGNGNRARRLPPCRSARMAGEVIA